MSRVSRAGRQVFVAGIAGAMFSCADTTITDVVGEFDLTPAGREFTLGPVTLAVPPNAVTRPVTLTVAASNTAPSSNKLVGFAVSITMDPDTTLIFPAVLEIDYSGFTADPHIPLATLGLHHAEGGAWVEIPHQNTSGVVVGSITSFSDFALLGRRATTVTAASPTAQSAPEGSGVPVPPSVTVLADDGQPLQGVTVTFAVTGGGGSILPATQVTNSNGVAAASSWTLGGTAGPNSATATVGTLTAVTFNADGTDVVPGSTIFTATWGTATGNTLNAITDGGIWPTTSGGFIDSVVTVVPGGPLGWTKTPNVIRFQQRGTRSGLLILNNAVPLSTNFWGRMYFRNDETVTNHQHVYTLQPGGDIQLSIWNRRGYAGGVMIWIKPFHDAGTASQPPYPYYAWKIGTRGVPGTALLANGTWYRYEWMIEYVTATTYRIWPRIYSMAGGPPIFDADSYFQNDYNGTSQSLKDYYDSGKTFGFTDANIARNFGMGNEGPGGSTWTLGYWYHADVALSLSGWIGP